MGQANKRRAVALRQQRITRSLFAAYSLDLVRINRRTLDVRSRARTRRNPRVLACLLQLWLEVLRGNHNTRHLRRSNSMAGQKLIARTQRGTVLDRLAAARGRPPV